MMNKPKFALKPEKSIPLKVSSSIAYWGNGDYSKLPKFRGKTELHHQGGRLELFDSTLVSRIRTNKNLIQELYRIAHEGRLPGDLDPDVIAEIEREDPFVPLRPGWIEGMPWPEGAPLPNMGGRARYLLERARRVWRLIEAGDRAVRLLDHEYDFQGQPPAKERDKLADVANKARRLMRAMHDLGGLGVGAFHSTAKAMAAEGLHPVAVQMVENAQAGHLLGSAWDVIADLEKVARKSRDRVNVSQKTEVSSRMASSLATKIIFEYGEIFREPPTASRESWFVDFMDTLGKGIHLSCGHRTVQGALGRTNARLLRDKTAATTEN